MKADTFQQRSTVVQSQEEYIILAEAIKQQGGYITHANDGYVGIKVEYMIPNK